MIAEIITIGDEILIGQVVDSNSAWIAESLNQIGIRVGQITSISDDPEHITQTLEQSRKRARLILLTGGLGPTKDDLTKKVLTDYFGSKLVFNQEALERIEKFLGDRGVAMNELNRAQAMLPDNCKLIPNRYGTASGMWFRKDEIHVISMPGVPYEMKGMMTGCILPDLRKELNLPRVEHLTILVQGIPESHLAKKLEEFENQLPDEVKLAYLPSAGTIRLRLSAATRDMEVSRDLLEKEAEKIRKIIPEFYVGPDNERLEALIGQLMKEKGTTLATAESCTGGHIANMIVSVPGASNYFRGAVVAYANEIKTGLLGIDQSSIEKYGAVSEPVVRQMAENARKMMKADYAIATSGIAGPEGGTEEKPVGTIWLAVASASITISERYQFGDVRDRNIRKSAVTALNMLRKLVSTEN